MVPGLVSVIIATYNRSNILPYSIGSVLDQTYQKFEILVVGDGCTDDSEQVVKAIDDVRIRWIGLTENSGHQSTPNNTGLREAKGEFVAYLGHDDLWFPHHLQVCVDAIREGSDVAYGLCLRVAEDGLSTAIYSAELYSPGMWIPPSSTVHKRAIIGEVGGWQDYRILDCDPEVDLWRRMYKAGYRFRLAPRLSVIKIPAAIRKDVYITREQHEQHAWSEKIRTDPALEVKQLVQWLVNAHSFYQSDRGRIPYAELLSFFTNETLFRVKRRTRLGLRRLLPRRHAGTEPNGHAIDRKKKYKGLTTTS
jgi:glycosyltransferase involved in cell wall biosynthesis